MVCHTPLAVITDILNSLLYVTYRIIKISKLSTHAPLCDACVKTSSKRADSVLLLWGQESVEKLCLYSHTLHVGKEQMQPLCLGELFDHFSFVVVWYLKEGR